MLESPSLGCGRLLQRLNNCVFRGLCDGTTVPPTTAAPATLAPATLAPTTLAPTTDAPTSDVTTSPTAATTVSPAVDETVEFEIVAATATSNRQCAPVRLCPEGTYTAAEPTASSNRVCAPCSTCSTGEYIATPCNASGSDTHCAPCLATCSHPAFPLRSGTCAPDGVTDYTCVPCTNSVCPVGMHRTGVCGRTSAGFVDGFTCQPCLTACPADQYLAGVCNGTQAPQCAPCTNTQCPAGAYRMGTCGGTGVRASANNYTCEPCVRGCPVGLYLSGPCDTLAAGPTCLPCDDLVCPDGTFNAAGTLCGFVPEADRCQACRMCPTNTYQVNGSCSGTRNSECVLCTDTCTSGEFLTGSCNAFSGPACESCATCAAGTYQVGGCVGREDVLCENCTTTCDVGTYLSGSCTPTTTPTCKPCTPCATGTYQVGGCDGTGTNTICAPCVTTADCTLDGTYLEGVCTATTSPVCSVCDNATCPIGFFRSGTCGGMTNSYMCEPCRTNTTCAADTYLFGACEGTSNPRCMRCDEVFDACGGNQYSVGSCSPAGNFVTCVNCSTCPPGEFAAQECHGATNVVCATCPPGTFSAEFDSSTCTPHQTLDCGRGFALTTVPSLVTDGVCTACPPGEQQLSALFTGATCRPMRTNCSAGQYVRVLATASTARVCAACPPGTFQSALTHASPTCVPVIPCAAGQVRGGLFKTGRVSSRHSCMFYLSAMRNVRDQYQIG